MVMLQSFKWEKQMLEPCLLNYRVKDLLVKKNVCSSQLLPQEYPDITITALKNVCRALLTLLHFMYLTDV